MKRKKKERERKKERKKERKGSCTYAASLTVKSLPSANRTIALRTED